MPLKDKDIARIYELEKKVGIIENNLSNHVINTEDSKKFILNQISEVKDVINSFKILIEGLKDKISDYDIVRKIAYGISGTILLGVLYAIIKLVII